VRGRTPVRRRVVINLKAQIDLINVPQDFMRLCNAVLQADHGDDFLPIDDDRADRGNDGYLKSERRLFAAHCFKRIQNQSIDDAIKRKMVGDLGKAITLKEEGLWDIDAWTFLSNYPVSESLGAQLLRLGGGAGIDVSWRGSDFLADGLQRHPSIRDQFPQLQVNEIAEQLAALQRTVEQQASQDIDQSVDPVAADGDFKFYGVPETAAQQTALLHDRPPGWEYLLYAAVLLRGKKDLESKWHDHELEIARGTPQYLDLSETASLATESYGRLSSLVSPITRTFDASFQEKAFGAPGEPGDAERIEYFAAKIISSYEAVLDWQAELRAIEPAPLYAGVMEITARVADQPLAEIRAFIDEVVSGVAQIPEHHASGSEETLRIQVSLVLTVDDEVMANLDAELKRIQRLAEEGFNE
jgi:hypothetical protein